MPERRGSRASSWLIAGFLVIGVITGSLLFPDHQSEGPWPSTGVVTLTGYQQLSPSNLASAWTPVVLTSTQVKTLDALVSVLPKASAPECMENSAVFTISYASRAGQPSRIDATDWECPAPGVFVLDAPSGNHKSLGSVCDLKSFIDQTFPGNEAEGTKQELQQYCR